MNPIISSVLTVMQTRLHDAVADVRWRSRFGTPPMTPDETSATSGDFKDAVDELLLYTAGTRCAAAACCGRTLRFRCAELLALVWNGATYTVGVFGVHLGSR